MSHKQTATATIFTFPYNNNEWAEENCLSYLRVHMNGELQFGLSYRKNEKNSDFTHSFLSVHKSISGHLKDQAHYFDAALTNYQAWR